MNHKIYFDISFLKNKLSLSVYVIVIAWLFFDVNARFFKPINLNSVQQSVNDFQPFVLPQINEKFAVKLSGKYKKYRVLDELKKEKTLGMTLTQQALQQGKLDTFFSGDNKLKLKAVIKTNNTLKKNYYALIEIENIVTNTKKITKYYQDETLFGYKLSILNNTQVNLFSSKNNMNNITLVMYKN